MLKKARIEEPESRGSPDEDVLYDVSCTTYEAAMELKQLEMLDADQLDRYEHFRRSFVPQEAIKGIITDYFKTSHVPEGMEVVINEDMVIHLQGLAKLYVGGLVETARTIMVSRGEEGQALLPRHYREAYAR
jgi:transcription initiation factor TFIID subunit 11